MPIKNTPDEQTPASLGVATNGYSKPDPAMVEALMHVYNFGTWAPSDDVRRSLRFDDGVRECCLSRNPNNFYPPENLRLKDGKLTTVSREYWQEVADLLLTKAQRKALDEKGIELLAKQAPKEVIQPHIGSSIRDNKHNFYFWLNPGDRPEDLAKSVDEFVSLARARIKNALGAVMTERATMEEVQRTALTHRALVLEIVLKEQIDRVEYIRRQTEQPEDQRQFIAMLNDAIAFLQSPERTGGISYDLKGVEAELLTGRDAIAYGCDGLYTPRAGGGKNAKVSIPMSVYGTDKIREWDEVSGILAHEVAHHIILKHSATTAGTVSSSNHNTLHSAIANQILQILRRYPLQKNISPDIQSPAHYMDIPESAPAPLTPSRPEPEQKKSVPSQPVPLIQTSAPTPTLQSEPESNKNTLMCQPTAPINWVTTQENWITKVKKVWHFIIERLLS